jgi:tetratricopeptide (TPR) repeat protein
VLRNNRGALLEMMGDLTQAEDVLRAALADDPSLPQLSKNLGDLFYRAARYDDAWEAYQRAVKLNPKLGDDVYFKLGNIAYKRLDRESAAEFWRKTLELNPGHELARTNLETVSALT